MLLVFLDDIDIDLTLAVLSQMIKTDNVNRYLAPFITRLSFYAGVDMLKYAFLFIFIFLMKTLGKYIIINNNNWNLYSAFSIHKMFKSAAHMMVKCLIRTYSARHLSFVCLCCMPKLFSNISLHSESNIFSNISSVLKGKTRHEWIDILRNNLLLFIFPNPLFFYLYRYVLLLFYL